MFNTLPMSTVIHLILSFPSSKIKFEGLLSHYYTFKIPTIRPSPFYSSINYNTVKLPKNSFALALPPSDPKRENAVHKYSKPMSISLTQLLSRYYTNAQNEKLYLCLKYLGCSSTSSCIFYIEIFVQ